MGAATPHASLGAAPESSRFGIRQCQSHETLVLQPEGAANPKRGCKKPEARKPGVAGSTLSECVQALFKDRRVRHRRLAVPQGKALARSACEPF